MRSFLDDRELGESYRPSLIDEVSTLILEEKQNEPPVHWFDHSDTDPLAHRSPCGREACGVTPFEADGIIADVLKLFPCAIKDEKKADRAGSQATLKEVAARLVTKDGVYAFLETPENRGLLKNVNQGPR